MLLIHTSYKFEELIKMRKEKPLQYRFIAASVTSTLKKIAEKMSGKK